MKMVLNCLVQLYVFPAVCCLGTTGFRDVTEINMGPVKVARKCVKFNQWLGETFN